MSIPTLIFSLNIKLYYVRMRSQNEVIFIYNCQLYLASHRMTLTTSFISSSSISSSMSSFPSISSSPCTFLVLPIEHFYFFFLLLFFNFYLFIRILIKYLFKIGSLDLAVLCTDPGQIPIDKLRQWAWPQIRQFIIKFLIINLTPLYSKFITNSTPTQFDKT
uniref:Uncharacterized protein n=2 Tax=Cacopsylla melanoneura TaxID=428564 RepID=A0A8D9BIH0_9HEMI